jgi:hypothetical protein
MYEDALKYLELSSARDRLPASMKADIPLERILLLQESLKNVRSASQSEERIAQIEKGLKDFLAQSPDHPRRSETHLKLADIYLGRGKSLLDEAAGEARKEGGQAKSDEIKAKARAVYQEASKAFETINTDLKPVLESMKGASIKPNESEKLAQREKYQNEYRQAEILNSITMKSLAETYPADSAEWKQWLEKSDKRLGEIVEKCSGPKQAGAKFLSLLHRGYVQSLLGQVDAARESFTRVADNEEDGIFRMFRVQAVAALVRLDSSPKSAKYDAALGKGQELLKSANSRERSQDAWLDLQLAMAEANIAYASSLDSKKDDGKIRNLRRDAREALQDIVKRPNPSQSKAREILKELGIEVKANEDTKLPETKTFGDSLKAARTRLDQAETGGTTLGILQQQLQSGQDVQQQIQAVTDDAARDRAQAIELYLRALAQFKEGDSREELLQARFLLGYLHLQLERDYEAVAISDVVMRSARGTETAEKAAGFALMGLGRLIDGAPAERQAPLIRGLEQLAQYMTDNMEGSPQADQAIDILVRLSMREKDWASASRFMGMRKSKGGPMAFILGRVQWSQYLQSMYQHRQNKTPPAEEDELLKQQAEKWLSESWQSLESANCSKESLEGTNDLVGLYLRSGRLKDAEKVLNEPGKGSLAQAENVADTPPSVKLDAYRYQLQAMVQATSQGGAALSSEQVITAIDKMKQLADADGTPGLLTSKLQNLAADVQTQLEQAKDAEQQAKLADAFRILIEQLVVVGNDSAMLESAGSSMYALASNLERVPALAAKVPGLMQVAEKAFDKLMALPAEQLTNSGRKPEELQLKLALARRGAGKFEAAHELFVKSLTKSNNNITIQVEAAKNLQSWAALKDPVLVKRAMLGSDPGANKKNIIWGWGRIAQTTSAFEQFRQEFYNARLNVARCRTLLGDLEPDPAKKQKLYEQGIGDINATVVTYPDLGGKENFEQFDRLMRELQQKAGKPNTGLPLPASVQPASQ